MFIGYKQTNKQTDRETICKVNIINVHCSAMHFEYQSKFLKIRSYWVWFCELLMKKKNKTEIIQIQQSKYVSLSEIKVLLVDFIDCEVDLFITLSNKDNNKSIFLKIVSSSRFFSLQKIE